MYGVDPKDLSAVLSVGTSAPAHLSNSRDIVEGLISPVSLKNIILKHN